MAQYRVSNRYKKSVIDTENWVHSENNSKRFLKEIGWRWGQYQIEISDEDYADIDPNDESGEFYPYSYDDCELISCDDGCWEELIFGNEITAEEREQIQAAYDNDWDEGLESLGYVLEDSETLIQGPIDIESVEDE